MINDQFSNVGYYYLKDSELFSNASFQNLFISKKLSVKKFLPVTRGTQETARIFTWICESIILSIRHFEGPTEVQLKSW